MLLVAASHASLASLIQSEAADGEAVKFTEIILDSAENFTLADTVDGARAILTEQQLASLPEGWECSICMESTTDGIFRTDCKHNYHRMCLFLWLVTSADCPNCRANITKQQLGQDLFGKVTASDACDLPFKNGAEIIYFLICGGRMDLALEFIAHPKINLDGPIDKSGKTLVHFACSRGLAGLLDTLVEFKAGISTKAVHGGEPIHMACLHGNLTVLSRLLDIGANIHAKANDGSTVMHCACARGRLDIFDKVIESGGLIDEVDCNGTAPIHYASKYGHVQVLTRLIELQANLNVCDKKGRTPYEYAAANQQHQACAILADNGAIVPPNCVCVVS